MNPVYDRPIDGLGFVIAAIIIATLWTVGKKLGLL